MNIFKFIGNVLNKSSIAIDKMLDFVVVSAETATETVEIAQISVRTLKAEQQLELDAVSAPPKRTRASKATKA